MFKAYREKRIVHINVNIILAGIFSTMLASYPVFVASSLIQNMWVFALVSFVIDGVIDFALFGLLHFFVYAFHLKKNLAVNIFFNDIVRIQKQRIILSVLFFVLAVSGHLVLLHLGFNQTGSYVVSYILSIFIIRIVHTYLGLKRGLFVELRKKL